MRPTILAAAVAFVVGGAATGAVLSQAQPAPPPAAVDGQPPQPPAPPHRWMGWGHRQQAGRDAAMRNFALVYRQSDRQLAPADVQKIAEAFLLWNGNHTWKVANVAATADGPIGFDLTTPDGTVLAKFTMDPHTARIHRIG
jgi:hypothetical protein